MNRYKTLLRRTIEFRCSKCYKKFRNSLEEFEEHVRKGNCKKSENPDQVHSIDNALNTLIMAPPVLFIKVKSAKVSQKSGYKKIEFQIEVGDQNDNKYTIFRCPDHIVGLKNRENMSSRSQVMMALDNVIQTKDWLSDLKKLTVQHFLNDIYRIKQVRESLQIRSFLELGKIKQFPNIRMSQSKFSDPSANDVLSSTYNIKLSPFGTDNRLRQSHNHHFNESTKNFRISHSSSNSPFAQEKPLGQLNYKQIEQYINNSNRQHNGRLFY